MALTFDIGGLTYDLLDIDDFDFDQGARIKQLTGGMGLFDLQEGFNTGDMDVWRGLLLMSIQVKNPTFTMADLGKLKILPVILSYMESVKEEAAKAVPPTEAPADVKAPARRPSRTASDSAAAPVEPGAQA
jgi:hypothetical protein